MTSLALAPKAAAAAFGANALPAGYITHLAPLQPAAFLRLAK
jgi:hypothetical protein